MTVQMPSIEMDISGANNSTIPFYIHKVKAATLGAGELLFSGCILYTFLSIIVGHKVAKEASDKVKQSRNNFSMRMWAAPLSKSASQTPDCLVFDVPYHLQKMHWLQEYFQRLNQVGSGLFLLAIAVNIPWVSFRFVKSLPSFANDENESDIYELKLLIWSLYLLYGVMLYLAAETKNLVSVHVHFNIPYV